MKDEGRRLTAEYAAALCFILQPSAFSLLVEEAG